MSATVPTALDQLLLKLIAIAGVPYTSRQYINFLSGATGVDNPNFTVNGEVVGSTDITIPTGTTLPSTAYSGVTYKQLTTETSVEGTTGSSFIAPVNPVNGELLQIWSDGTASVTASSTPGGVTMQDPALVGTSSALNYVAADSYINLSVIGGSYSWRFSGAQNAWIVSA